MPCAMNSRPAFQKKSKIGSKMAPKVIVDAERDRRTLEEPANQDYWFGVLGNGEPAKKQPKGAKRERKGCKRDSKSFPN